MDRTAFEITVNKDYMKKHEQTALELDRIRPTQVANLATLQILQNPAIQKFFRDRLKCPCPCKNKAGKTVAPKTVKEYLELCYLPVQITQLGATKGHINCKLFRPRWRAHADNTMALDESLFVPDTFDTDAGDERDAAAMLVHEFTHWLECFCLRKKWKKTPEGRSVSSYDTGHHVESMIKSEYYKEK